MKGFCPLTTSSTLPSPLPFPLADVLSTRFPSPLHEPLFPDKEGEDLSNLGRIDGELVWAHQINEEEQMHQKMDDNATYCGCAAQILKACTTISDQIRLEFPQEEFSLQNQNTQHAGSQPACTVTKTKLTSQMLRVDICDNPFQTTEQVMTEKCHCTRPHPAQTR